MCGLELANVWGGGQGGFCGAVWGSMIISAQAYTEGEASNEAEVWAFLWPVIDSDGEVGFCGVLSGHWCGFRQRSQLLMEALPASAKCAVCKIRAGWVEAA